MPEVRGTPVHRMRRRQSKERRRVCMPAVLSFGGRQFSAMEGVFMKSLGVDLPQGQVRTSHRANPATKFSRIPRSVLYDLSLTPCDRLVYAALADQVWQGNVAKIGERLMASKLGISRSKVQASLKALLECGAVTKAESRIGNRNCYVLASPVFGQKQTREDVIVSSPRGQRYVSMDHDRHGIKTEVA